MPLDPVELTKQIKSASDIVAVVGTYLALKPAGATFKALCPFHNDSRPSMDVDPRRQRYRCWSCSAHGDVITFVQHMEKVGFKEARSILATRAGIKLDEAPSPQDHARTRLHDIMRWAQQKYQECLLNDPLAEPARKYLGERKLSGKTVRDFGLGFAPIAGDWITKLAHAEDVPNDVLEEVGLIAPRAEGRGFYDRFRDRVMFPIKDVQARPIAFGGRIMPDSPYASRAPKYYNSTETPLFSKSDVLYGLDLARQAAAHAGYLALVEGYTDVMMAHQCGVPQVVAAMGTALNSRHVRQICRYVPKVVLVYDADTAGNIASDKGLEQFLPYHEIEVAIATLPPGLDPCDLLARPGGVEVFTKALATAVDALDFSLDRLFEQNPNPSVEATRRIVDKILARVALAPNAKSTAWQVKVELTITRLAHRLGIRQETVWARLGELRKEQQENERRQAAWNPAPAPKPPTGNTPDEEPATEPEAPPAKAGKAVAIERQLIELLLAEPLLVPAARRTIGPELITHTGLRRVLTEMFALDEAGVTADIDGLREQLRDRPDLAEWTLQAQYVGQHMQDREEWLGRIVKRFDQMKTEAEQRKVREQLVSSPVDEDETRELLRKLQNRGRVNLG